MDYQAKALHCFHEHFKSADRGRLIMACGTGKTFISLRIAENEATNGLVLFLVPSIALLGQTLEEWSTFAVKYGVAWDYVHGLQAITAQGSVLELGGKVAKNSSGYSSRDLIVWSEGMLSVVTLAMLKLVPLPKYKITLLVPFPDLVTAIGTVPEPRRRRWSSWSAG